MADIKVSQMGEVLVASDNDLLNLVSYDDQNQTYISGKVKASTMKDYMIGDTDISDLGDGTPTGAIDALDDKIDDNYDEGKEQWQKNGAYNHLPLSISTIKSLNTSGMWAGSTFTPTIAPNLSITVNADYTIAVSGYTGSDAVSLIMLDNPTNLNVNGMLLCGCPSGGSASTYDLSIYDATAHIQSSDYGSGVIINAESGHNFNVFFRIRANQTLSGTITFKPMTTTDLNATYDDYVPHAMTNRQLTDALGKVKEIRTGKFNFTNGASISGSVTYDTPFTGTGNKIVLVTPESGSTTQIHVFCVNGQSNTGFNYIAKNVTGDTSSSNRVAQYIAISY